jgi:hypothetical protein
LCWTKSGGTSEAISGCRPSSSSESSRVANEFMSTSGIRAPVAARRARICCTITSRKAIPSLTSTSDFARSMPIDVPSPPLSLMTTASSSGASASGSASASGRSVTGSMADSGIIPVSPPSSCS